MVPPALIAFSALKSKMVMAGRRSAPTPETARWQVRHIPDLRVLDVYDVDRDSLRGASTNLEPPADEGTMTRARSNQRHWLRSHRQRRQPSTAWPRGIRAHHDRPELDQCWSCDRRLGNTSRGRRAPGFRIRRGSPDNCGHSRVPQRQYIRVGGIHLIRDVLVVVFVDALDRWCRLDPASSCQRCRFDARDLGSLHPLHVDFHVSQEPYALDRLPAALDHVLPAGGRGPRHGRPLARGRRLCRRPDRHRRAVCVVRRDDKRDVQTRCHPDGRPVGAMTASPSCARGNAART